MLLGADKRELGVLVFPDEEYLAATGAGDEDTGASSSSTSALQQVLFREVTSLNAARPDYHPEDHIAHIQVGEGEWWCTGRFS